MATPSNDLTLDPVLLVCPTCGAAAQSGPECRRCHSDLQALQHVLAQRAATLHTLAQALASGRWAEALDLAHAVHQLRQDAESFRLLAVCQLLNNQPAGAYDTHLQYCTTTAAQP